MSVPRLPEKYHTLLKRLLEEPILLCCLGAAFSGCGVGYRLNDVNFLELRYEHARRHFL